jgi:hypothetical protein
MRVYVHAYISLGCARACLCFSCPRASMHARVMANHVCVSWCLLSLSFAHVTVFVFACARVRPYTCQNWLCRCRFFALLRACVCLFARDCASFVRVPCERALAPAQRHAHASVFVFACARVCARICQTWVCGCLFFLFCACVCVHARVMVRHVCARVCLCLVNARSAMHM